MSLKGKLSVNNTLSANTSIPDVIRTSGASSWNEISGKPFNTVDTEGGLTIQDHTLMIDTLDTISTIDYVNQQIDGVTTTLEDYALKSEIPTVPTDVSAFTNDAGYITDTALTPYVEESELASVATSGSYNDLIDTPTIPVVPTDVSAFNNDAGYITDTALTPYVSSSDLSTALTPYVEASSLTTVAYSGDYDDLINKPTIPSQTEVTVTQTLQSGTEIGKIDVDGVTTVLYAPSGGSGSVNIDNKSLISNNGVIQEAVPIYSEEVTEEESDTYFNAAEFHQLSDTFTLTDQTIEDIYQNYNPVERFRIEYDDGEDIVDWQDWNVSLNNTFTDWKDRQWSVEVDGEDLILTCEQAISTDTISVEIEYFDGNDYQTFNGDATSSEYSEESYSFYDDGLANDLSESKQVDVSIIYNDDTILEVENIDLGDDLESYEDTNHYFWNIWESNGTFFFKSSDYTSGEIDVEFTRYYDTTETVVHKLPSQYLNIDNSSIKVNGSGNLYAESVNAKMGIKISNRDISVNSDLNAFGPVDMGGIRREEWLSSLTTPIGTYIGGGIIKTDSNANVSNIRYTTWPSLLFDSSSTRREKWRCTNFTGDQNLRRVHTQVRYYKWYDSKWFGPYYISGMFIGQRINGKYEIKVEGWESILDSIVPIDNGWGGYSGYTFTFKEDITLSPTDSEVAFPFIWCSGLDNIPDPQKINSYFLPIDNKSIKRDSDGNIYAGYIVANADGSLRATQPSTTYNTSDGTFIVGTDNTHSGTLSSFVSGYHNQATGARGIIVGGQYNIASNECELVTGQYNYDTSILNRSIARITGNGFSTSNRSNAEVLDSQGNLFLAGNVYTNVSDWSDPIGHSSMMRNIPTPPTTDGTYTLQVTVSNGTPTYSWV